MFDAVGALSTGIGSSFGDKCTSHSGVRAPMSSWSIRGRISGSCLKTTVLHCPYTFASWSRYHGPILSAHREELPSSPIAGPRRKRQSFLRRPPSSSYPSCPTTGCGSYSQFL